MGSGGEKNKTNKHKEQVKSKHTQPLSLYHTQPLSLYFSISDSHCCVSTTAIIYSDVSLPHGYSPLISVLSCPCLGNENSYFLADFGFPELKKTPEKQNSFWNVFNKEHYFYCCQRLCLPFFFFQMLKTVKGLHDPYPFINNLSFFPLQPVTAGTKV